MIEKLWSCPLIGHFACHMVYILHVKSQFTIHVSRETVGRGFKMRSCKMRFHMQWTLHRPCDRRVILTNYSAVSQLTDYMVFQFTCNILLLQLTFPTSMSVEASHEILPTLVWCFHNHRTRFAQICIINAARVHALCDYTCFPKMGKCSNDMIFQAITSWAVSPWQLPRI